VLDRINQHKVINVLFDTEEDRKLEPAIHANVQSRNDERGRGRCAVERPPNRGLASQIIACLPLRREVSSRASGPRRSLSTSCALICAWFVLVPVAACSNTAFSEDTGFGPGAFSLQNSSTPMAIAAF